jgi:hypothetical protein
MFQIKGIINFVGENQAFLANIKLVGIKLFRDKHSSLFCGSVSDKDFF